MNREDSARVAVITGASRGLGELLARFLAGQGYHLILNARGGAALDAVVRSLASYDVQVKAIAGDVSEPSTRRAILQLAKALGGLDILINNASNCWACRRWFRWRSTRSTRLRTCIAPT
ncbi:MAG: SDR family NAD(P)-dependent oxidoreductase [Anaerolineae bacterium]